MHKHKLLKVWKAYLLQYLNFRALKFRSPNFRVDALRENKSVRELSVLRNTVHDFALVLI